MMWPLPTKTFPASAAELERLLNESVSEVLSGVREPVQVLDDVFPALKEISIALNGATVRPDPPRPSLATAQGEPAFTVAKFSLRGDGVTIGPASMRIALDARGVEIHRGTEAGGNILLSFAGVAEGHLEIATARRDLEEAIGEIAKTEAAKHGVTIEGVRLSLEQLGPRALTCEINLRAKKLFFSAEVRIAGQLEIDDELNASLTGLSCQGEGAVGAIACSFLTPQLEKLNGRTFALMSFAIGEIRLRDVRISAGEAVELAADFGT